MAMYLHEHRQEDCTGGKDDGEGLHFGGSELGIGMCLWLVAWTRLLKRRSECM